jgi:hypothetical protein
LIDSLNSTSLEEIHTTEAALEASQVVALARQDLDFLAALALPEVYKYAFPPLYQEMWVWMCGEIDKGRNFAQLAIGLPRGFAKTLLIKLFILYTVLFTRRQFILIISENEDKSKSIIADVSDMLDEPNIKAAFGDWQLGSESSTQVKKVFGFRGRPIILKGVGAGTGIRGITEKNRRPDLMIFDDIQSREDAESPVLSAQLEKWMYSTAMKAKSPEGCLFVFIANMYPTNGSLLKRLKSNHNWVKFIVGGITDSGESLWEELQPLEQLLKEFQNDLAAGHPEIFYAEVLNDENAAVNNLVDLSQLPDYKYQDNDIPQGRYIIIDPSNAKLGSDLTSIGMFEVWDGYPAMRKLVEGRFSPADTIREAIQLALEYRISIVAIESNAYQASLNYWFEFICQQMGIEGISPVEVYSGAVAKNSRILSMFRALAKGEILLHPEVRPAVYLQIGQFQPLKRDNNDGILDLLCYGPKVLEMYGTEILNSNIIAEQESNAMAVIEYNSPF